MEPKTGVDPLSLLEHRDFVRAIVRGLLADEHAVDDVVQETCLRALERPPRPAALRVWLARVGRNLALTVRRRERTRDRRERAGARPEGQPSASEAASKLERLRLVVDAVLALEEPFRSAILLRFYEDLPPREIARQLGVPVDTVRSRLRRGLERLRSHLDERHGGDRAAWSLALLPLLGAREAAALSAAATGGGTKVLLVEGAVMSAKAKLVGVAVVLFALAAGTVTWQATAARDRTSAARSERTRPVADVEGARGQADATVGTVVETTPEFLPDHGIGPPGATDQANSDQLKPYRLAEATGDALGALRFIVTDESGAGVPDAKIVVTLQIGDRAQTEEHTCGTDGRLQIRSLQPGRRSVDVTALGRRRCAQVEVVAGGVTEVTVVFAGGATVEGEVRHVERGPLAGVNVLLRADNCGFQEWFRTRADDQGRYRFRGVPSGTHPVFVSGQFVGYDLRPRAECAVTGFGVVTKDIVLGRIALRGTVRDAEGGNAIPGARVMVQQGEWFGDAKTNARGAYEIMDMAAGEYRVDITKDGYAEYTEPCPIPAEGGRTADFTLGRAATLVLDALDRSGRAVPGRLYLDIHAVGQPSTNTVGAEVVVDSTGTGRYTMIVPGAYEITFRAPGYVRQTAHVVIKPGENAVSLRLEPAAEQGRISLQGTVRDSSTRLPIPDVRVVISQPIFMEATTDADGVYRFREVKPTAIVLAVSKDGYGVRYLRDDVGAETKTLDVDMDPAETLHLHVTDKAGHAVVGRVFLGMFLLGEKPTNNGTYVEADAQGDAVYRQIVPGRYTLTVSQAGVGEVKIEVEITSGENFVRPRLE